MNTFDFCILIKNKIYNFSFKLKKIILYLLIFKIELNQIMNTKQKLHFLKKLELYFCHKIKLKIIICM